MLSRLTSRAGWRATRVIIAWFALLALALPGFASVRGLCCNAGMAKITDCCAALTKSTAMKMPGMDSSQMESMTGNPVMDVGVAAADACAMVPADDAPEFIVRSESSVERDLLPGQNQLPALAGTRGEELVVAASPSFFVYKTPPKLFFFDPLSVSLRI